MFKRKKRILFVSEASYSDTGFGRYYYELLSRLVATNRYDIAELGCWGTVNHPKDHVIKWKYYANQPSPGSPEEELYRSSSNNKFGFFRFEKVVIDFMPDIVISLRDIAMDYWIGLSPLRKYFTWLISPPVDSAPQSNDFLASYYEADGIVTYTDYGFDVIKNEAPKSNLLCVNYPGINSEIFKPLDKEKCKIKYNLPLDKKIIGFVARNQIRKLFPNIIDDFRLFLEKTGRDDIVLHLHTTFPDLNPWNLAKHILESNIQDKIYITTICDKCKQSKTSLWITDCIICDNCDNKSRMKMKLNTGPSIDELAELYNCYDLYLHYASNEGLGYPAVEAAMCGVPICGIDYSATSDILRITEGIKLPPKILKREINVDALRAVPDSEALVDALTAFFKKNESEVQLFKKRTRELAVEAFNPQKNADKWAQIIDSIEIKNIWNLPKENVPAINIDLNDYSFIYELVYDIIYKTCPNDAIAHSYIVDEILIRNGNRGFTLSNGMTEPYKIENIVQWLESYIKSHKYCEQLRCGEAILERADYLDYAESKEICHNS